MHTYIYISVYLYIYLNLLLEYASLGAELIHAFI